MTDLDRFKHINDTRGHDIGDEVIVDFSRRMQILLRGNDWAARIGGEEFVVWLPGVKPAIALLIVERLRSNCEQTPLDVEGTTVNYTFGIGLHIVENAVLSRLNAWIKAADTLLYRAKSEGRNRVVFQREMMA